MKHYPIGGSTFARTMNCPGWLKASEGIPRSPASVYALRGSACHRVMEDLLLEDPMAVSEFIDEYRGTIYKEGGQEIAFDDDMIQACHDASNALEQLFIDFDIAEYEPEVTGEYIAEEAGGTADFVGVSADETTVVVADFKFGSKQIDAEDNHQLRACAVFCRHDGARDLFANAERVVLAIIQPNERGLPVLRTWEITLDELDTYQVAMNVAIMESRRDDPPLDPGDWCQYCPAAPTCPAKRGEAEYALTLEPEQLEDLGEALALSYRVQEWASTVQKKAHEVLEYGGEVTGYKLVAKASRRNWCVDEDTIFKKFARKLGGKRNLVTGKVVSPAQIEKLAKKLGKTIDLEGLVEKHSTGTTLAPEDDRRPAVVGTKAAEAALRTLGTK